MDEIFQALSDTSRRHIVERLSKGPASVSELANMLPIARPGVSRHLRVLRAAGLVTVSSDAQFRIYRLNAAPLAVLEDWLQGRRGQWEQRMDALNTEIARGKRARTGASGTKTKEAS